MPRSRQGVFRREWIDDSRRGARRAGGLVRPAQAALARLRLFQSAFLLRGQEGRGNRQDRKAGGGRPVPRRAGARPRGAGQRALAQSGRDEQSLQGGRRRQGARGRLRRSRARGVRQGCFRQLRRRLRQAHAGHRGL